MCLTAAENLLLATLEVIQEAEVEAEALAMIELAP